MGRPKGSPNKPKYEPLTKRRRCLKCGIWKRIAIPQFICSPCHKLNDAVYTMPVVVFMPEER